MKSIWKFFAEMWGEMWNEHTTLGKWTIAPFNIVLVTVLFLLMAPFVIPMCWLDDKFKMNGWNDRINRLFFKPKR